jgi:predicted DNA binding CopG/RHH family protein
MTLHQHNQRGRPFQVEGSPRSKSIKLTVTDDELAWLRRRAASRGVPVTAVIRLALARYSRAVHDPATF